MATLTIRDFDDDLKSELRVRAAKNGRSMEAEVREILRTALTRPGDGVGMGTRIRRRFADTDSHDELTVEQPSRREPARFAELPE